MADITIPNEELASLLSVQILSSLSEATRNDLIAAALKYLITKPSGSYGSRQTPLEQAFEQALFKVAHRMADEVIAEETEAAGKVKEMFRKLITDMPDFYSDPELQTRVLKVMLDRAHEIRQGG